MAIATKLFQNLLDIIWKGVPPANKSTLVIPSEIIF